MKIERCTSPIFFARQLRKQQTPEETILWALLRNRKYKGYKFLRQHPIRVWETDGYFHFTSQTFTAQLQNSFWKWMDRFMRNKKNMTVHGMY